VNASTITLALLLAAAPATAAAETASRDTVAAIRNTGTALMRWLTDHPANPSNSSLGSPVTAVDWSRCPVLTLEHAAELLEPEYISELPRTDGWGNPLELCLLEGGDGDADHAIGARSPGADGAFEGDVYTVGGFDPDDVGKDVVWLDGFFVRWPQAAPPAQQ
jgi:hypothetical protein